MSWEAFEEQEHRKESSVKILIVNVGSTSLKFKLYEMPQERVLSRARVERIGSLDDAIFQHENLETGETVMEEGTAIASYQEGMDKYLAALTDPSIGVLVDVKEISCVGFKAPAAKGFSGTFELTEEVLRGMEEWICIAPLHNPAYIQAARSMRKVLPEAVMVACFETGFHRTIPLHKRLYGVPYEWYENYGIQRLGYHGASHEYIADHLNSLSPGGYRAVSCHLGGSSSVCAIRDGKSMDTSFGMTLESGLIHATRVGDMDCDLYTFLQHKGLTEREISDGYVRKGGLLGISGISGDLRYVEKAAEEGNERARLAIDVFVQGIVDYIGAFYVTLEGLDYLVFTAGIGENSPLIRSRVCQQLRILGAELDEEANLNARGKTDLTAPGSKIRILVIPTDEETGIARRTYEHIQRREEYQEGSANDQ